MALKWHRGQAQKEEQDSTEGEELWHIEPHEVKAVEIFKMEFVVNIAKVMMCKMAWGL